MKKRVGVCSGMHARRDPSEIDRRTFGDPPNQRIIELCVPRPRREISGKWARDIEKFHLAEWPFLYGQRVQSEGRPQIHPFIQRRAHTSLLCELQTSLPRAK